MIYPDRSQGSIDMACFCDTCLTGFSRQQHITIPDTCLTTSQKADWVMRKYSDAWNAYRCDLIATMVRDLSEKARKIKPRLTVNVHVVPWKEEDFGGADIRVAGQDLKKISHFADFISPMCYSQMLKRDAGWIADVDEALKPPSRGVVFFSWPLFEKDSLRMKVVKEVVTGSSSSLQE